MGGKEFVLAIVVLVLLFKLFDSYFRSRAGRREAEAEETARAAVDRLAELEERVRVLERIVTDDSFELRRRFRDLGS